MTASNSFPTLFLALSLVLACWSKVTHARAEAPLLVPVQSYLTDASGAPLDGTFNVRFRLYDGPDAHTATALFTEDVSLAVDDGYATVYLGDTSPLSLSIFRDTPHVFLGVRVGNDAEATPLIQVATVPFAAYARYCGDAQTLGGLDAQALRDSFVVSPATVQSYCFDSESELRATLDDNYAPASHTHSAFDALTATSLTSGSFAYSSARTFTMSVQGVEFDGFGTLCDVPVCRLMHPSGASSGFARLVLPNGATISGITCYYRDGATAPGENYTRFDVGLFAVSKSGTGVLTQLAQTNNGTTSDGTPTTMLTIADATIASSANPVDNSAYFYGLRLDATLVMGISWASQAKLPFYGCDVMYTMASLGY